MHEPCPLQTTPEAAGQDFRKGVQCPFPEQNPNVQSLFVPQSVGSFITANSLVLLKSINFGFLIILHKELS